MCKRCPLVEAQIKEIRSCKFMLHDECFYLFKGNAEIEVLRVVHMNVFFLPVLKMTKEITWILMDKAHRTTKECFFLSLSQYIIFF